MTDALTLLEMALMGWMRAYHAPWLDIAMGWVSASGGAGALWLLLAGVALLRPRDRASAWRVILSIGLAFLLVDGVLKPLVARARPVIEEVRLDLAAPTHGASNVRATAPKRDLPPMPRSYSFPSGHTASTFAAAITASRMWPAARIALWIVAVLIAYSRIYLGHHYPLDIVGGAIVGVAAAYWVLGGRHPATDARTLPRPLSPTVVVRP
jgi:undecaprenyl-diphosphatase